MKLPYLLIYEIWLNMLDLFFSILIREKLKGSILRNTYSFSEITAFVKKRKGKTKLFIWKIVKCKGTRVRYAFGYLRSRALERGRKEKLSNHTYSLMI